MSTNIKKKSLAQGSKFSYKYTDLATIHEEMELQGITYYQFTAYDERAGADYIYTVLKYGDDEEGKPLRGVKIVDGATLAGGNAAQQYGSALTYCRRYSLLMALGWATEDDDAASVVAKPQQPPRQNNGGGRLNFEVIKARLEQLATEEEVLVAKEKLLANFPNMTEKQRLAVDKIFKIKLEDLTDKVSDGWQEAKSV